MATAIFFENHKKDNYLLSSGFLDDDDDYDDNDDDDVDDDKDDVKEKNLSRSWPSGLLSIWKFACNWFLAETLMERPENIEMTINQFEQPPVRFESAPQ